MEGLIDTRDEYMEHIQDLLSIPISKRLYGLYNDCFSNKRTLKEFQNELLEIRKWNNNIVADEYKKVVKYTKCTYMHNLIKVIIISTIKIKIYEYKDQFDNIKIKVPNPEDFIHKCYINCAMFSWKNAYLFNRINIKNAEYQNNLNIIEENIRRIIKKTFRDFIPFEEIFLQIEKNLTDNVSQFNDNKSTASIKSSSAEEEDGDTSSEESNEDLLSIPISKRLYGLYNDCFSNKRTLKEFQNELLEIRKWNNNIVADEYKKVVKYTKCTYMHNLIKVIIISTIKIKIYEYKDQFDNIKIKVPNPEDFIHKCYINCAMFSWKNAYLFNRINIKNAEYQNNLNIIEENIRRIIKKTFRDFIPFEEIFLQIEKNLTDNVSQFNDNKSTASIKSSSAEEEDGDTSSEESNEDDDEDDEDDESEEDDEDDESSNDTSDDDNEEEQKIALNDCLQVPEINCNNNIDLDGYKNEEQGQVYTETIDTKINEKVSDKAPIEDIQEKDYEDANNQTSEKEVALLASYDFQENEVIENKNVYHQFEPAKDYTYKKEIIEKDDDTKSIASVASMASVATAISNVSDVKEIFINDVPKSSKKPSFF